MCEMCKFNEKQQQQRRKTTQKAKIKIGKLCKTVWSMRAFHTVPECIRWPTAKLLSYWRTDGFRRSDILIVWKVFPFADPGCLSWIIKMRFFSRAFVFAELLWAWLLTLWISTRGSWRAREAGSTNRVEDKTKQSIGDAKGKQCSKEEKQKQRKTASNSERCNILAAE